MFDGLVFDKLFEIFSFDTFSMLEEVIEFFLKGECA
jgi:hypothetical protein